MPIINENKRQETHVITRSPRTGCALTGSRSATRRAEETPRHDGDDEERDAGSEEQAQEAAWRRLVVKIMRVKMANVLLPECCDATTQRGVSCVCVCVCVRVCMCVCECVSV